MRDQIIIGSTSAPAYEITGNSIRGVSSAKNVDIIGAELAVDQLTMRVAGDVNDGKLVAPSDYDMVVSSDGYKIALKEGFVNLPSVPYGTEVRYSRENIVSVKIPRGRMHGDVNGDGEFSADDLRLIAEHDTGLITLTGEDFVAADMNEDDVVDTGDAMRAQRIMTGAVRPGTYPEITGNWENNPDYETDEAQFYADIQVPNATADMELSFTGDSWVMSNIVRVVSMNGAVRIYCLLCPSAQKTVAIVFPRNLFGLFYTKSIKRMSANLYQIDAISGVGLLDNQQHMGGLYSGQTFAQVAAEIIGGTIPYTIDDAVSSVAIYGWLPVATRRKNLHQLMLATGAALRKDANGVARFVFLSAGTPEEVEEGRIFLGGNIDFSTPASAVEITEHTFSQFADDETKSLFDNRDGSETADHSKIIFSDAPLYGFAVDGIAVGTSLPITINNMVVHETGVNYAIISGNGLLTGKKYKHIEKTVSLVNSESAGEENIISVTDATLVSPANSRNVARRVLAYYSSSKTVTASLVVDDENPGDQIAFRDFYGAYNHGFLAEMDINFSTTKKAACKIITDYSPQYQGNTYTQSRLLTGSGSFTVGTNGAQVTLISGGTGGYSGGNGTKGDDANGVYVGHNPYVVAEGGAGGVAGPGGTGGRIYTGILAPGEYTYTCGTGGAGGTASGTSPAGGASGTDTVIYKDGVAVFSSASGFPAVNGFVDIFTGSVYAAPGDAGVAGGKGGKVAYEGSGYAAQSVSYGGTTWAGGSNGGSATHRDKYYLGGAGGGAAVGNRGGDGPTPEEYDARTWGGTGAAARAQEAATGIGYGGPGGFGGGGGGGAGVNYDGDGWYFASTGGPGGAGGTGGKGGPGGIVIYE